MQSVYIEQCGDFSNLGTRITILSMAKLNKRRQCCGAVYCHYFKVFINYATENITVIINTYKFSKMYIWIITYSFLIKTILYFEKFYYEKICDSITMDN